MTFFSLLESFFFLSLGLTFLLVVLLVYHFKRRIDSLEKRIETLTDVTKTMLMDSTAASSKPPSSTSFMNSYLNLPKTDGPVVFTQYPNQESHEFPPDWNPVDDVYKNIIVSNMNISQDDDDDDSESGESGDSSEDGIREINDDNSDQDEQPPILNYHVEETVELNDIDIEVIPSSTEQEHEINDEVDEQYSTVVESTDESLSLEGLGISEIQVTKIEETVEDDDANTVDASVLTEDPDVVGVQSVSSKKSLQKMSVQMLRAMVIRDGLCTEPSKMKKKELIDLVLSNQQQSSTDDITNTNI
jgi:hypothetical protein